MPKRELMVKLADLPEIVAEIHRLQNALRWALGEGKDHDLRCSCIRCEAAHQTAHSDGTVCDG
jgi:hypothetical protein